MKQYLFLTSALVAFTMSGVTEAACIQTPSCSSLGYESTSSCSGGLKCPFGNAWNCTASDLSTQITELTNKITEQTNKITEITNKITTIEEKIVTIESGASSSNCFIGDILYSDMSCDPKAVATKKPIGVVFDRVNKLAIALDTAEKAWSDGYFDVPTLSNYNSPSAETADWQGKNNTRLMLEYCKEIETSCPAFDYVNSYKTEGTLAGDWYLPSMGELNAIYQKKDVLNPALRKIGGTQLSSDMYWSSYEHSILDAWLMHFGDGTVNHHSKGFDRYYVRPVLAF